MSLASTGWEVHLVAKGTLPNNTGGIIHHPLPASFRGGRLIRMLFVAFGAFRRAIATRADIFHFHDPELLPYGLLLKWLGNRVIYDAHEDLPRDLLTKPWVPEKLRRVLSIWVESIECAVARRLDVIVTATPFIRDRFLKANPRSIDINNFPQLKEFPCIDANCHTKERAVCYVGGINDIRGLFEMVEAIGLTDVRLLLAGRFDSSVHHQKAKGLNGWANVEELGQLGRDDAVRTLAKAMAGLVLFHPAPNHIDAQPNKLFEYMAAGIPVICSDFPLWKELVQGNDCGLCVDPLNPTEIAQAIRWMVDHPEDAERMGRNGRRAVEEKYTWEREGEKLVALYREILAQ